jgi:lysozyme family protein
MAASSYEAALARLLVHEGGYTNHPADPGGPTNFGITIYDYRKYVKPGATAADVRAMKVEEAKAIYRAKYWDAQRCDELPAGVDDCVFDYGVNSGIGRSGKVLRRVLGLPDNDWHTSDAVLAALRRRDAKAVIDAICDERLRFLKSLKTWPVFGKGWGARVAEVRAYALQLSAAASGKAPVPTPVATAPSEVQPTAKGSVPLHPVAKLAANHGSKIAAGLGTAGGVATAQNESAWHWLAAHPIEIVTIALAACAAIAAAVYAVNRFQQSQQEAATPGLKPVPAAA